VVGERSPLWPVLIAAQYLVAGWVVARLHPRHRDAMVIASAAGLFLLNALSTALWTYLVIRWTTHISLTATLLSSAVSLCLPLMTIPGGLWRASRDSRSLAD